MVKAVMDKPNKPFRPASSKIWSLPKELPRDEMEKKKEKLRKALKIHEDPNLAAYFIEMKDI